MSNAATALSLGSLPPEVVAQLVELARLKEKEAAKLKVSIKANAAGGIYVNCGAGMGGVNMKAHQWEALKAHAAEIDAFFSK